MINLIIIQRLFLLLKQIFYESAKSAPNMYSYNFFAGSAQNITFLW